MNNDRNTGVSPRSLLMLGGLAALAMNKDLRRNLIGGTRDAWHGAQSTLHTTFEDTLKPALNTAAEQASHAAHVAAKRSASVLDDLREEVPDRAHTLLGRAQSVVGDLTSTAQERVSELTDEAADMAEMRRRQAQKAAKVTQKKAARNFAEVQDAGQGLLSSLSSGVQHFMEQAGDDLDDRRREARRTLTTARRDAERELRRSRKNWNAEKLEKEVAKRVAPIHKQVSRELALLEREAQKRQKQGRSAVKAARVEQRRGGMGGLTTVALLGAGAVALARLPQVRRGILDAVDAVSPEAARSLHSYSRQARNLIGTAWLQSVEPEKQTSAPGVAAKTQGGTTGATWGASPAPDSSAAARTQAEQSQGAKPQTDTNTTGSNTTGTNNTDTTSGKTN